MNNNQYLNEENYQKTSKRINLVGNILLTLGMLMLISAITIIILAFTILNKPMLIGVAGPLLVFGIAFIGFGGQAKIIGNARSITAYFSQQQIPVAKEAINEMSPSIGKVAKEVTRGIKEGLNDK